jgi:hypothetical protein
MNPQPYPGTARFRDPFWPVILALLALGGFFTLLARTRLPLHGDHWYGSASTWTWVIGVALACAACVLWFVSPRVLCRRLQACAVLCLLVHSALAVVSLQARVFTDVVPQKKPAEVPKAQTELLRSVALENSHIEMAKQGRGQRNLFRAVDSPVPVPADPQSPPGPATEPPEVESRPLESVASTASVVAGQLSRTDPAAAPPRYREEITLLSRQLALVPPENQQPIRVPDQVSVPQLPRLSARPGEPSRLGTESGAGHLQGSGTLPTAVADLRLDVARLGSGGLPRRGVADRLGSGHGEPVVADPGPVSAAPSKRVSGALSVNTEAEGTEALSPSDAMGGTGMPGVPASSVTSGSVANADNVGRLAAAPGAAGHGSLPAGLGPGGTGTPGSAGMGDGVGDGVGVGLSDPIARRDSLQVGPQFSRFRRPEVTALPELKRSRTVPADPFRRRTQRTAGTLPGAPSSLAPGPPTEQAIEIGLGFLAREQRRNGSWSLQRSGEDAAIVSDTAATALALLAFQGAGYTHREHRYAGLVASGLAFLTDNQRPDGDLYLPLDESSNRSAWLYSHSIAALALSEAFGMTQDEQLREPAQRALDFAVKSQDPTYGGWRYTPGLGTDTSVTGWMMMALRSGELAGLQVPRRSYEAVHRWLEAAQKSPAEAYLYRYNPFAPDTPAQRHGRNTTHTMTAVGLLLRLYDGWHRDRAAMIQGAEYLQQNPPSLGTLVNPQRDTYYWYYGTQVMFHMGGEYWEDWNNHLHPLLIDSQVRKGPLAGSWDPRQPVPDRWGPQAGRLYVTAMNLLSLEVYYRHLPLYESTAQ